MATARLKRGWFRFLRHTLNPVAVRLARRGVGPMSLVRHTGRRSGRGYETPVIVARVPGGFVAELTYGPEVDWYRNLEAAGGGTVVWKGRPYTVRGIEPMATDEGRRAFGPARGLVLRLLRRHEFRLLREAPVTA
jgi:deazaflavin-dependent oxidoreductase (nitroreductase family)